MALFDGLDIPPELETLFNALLSLGNNSSSLGKRPVVSSGDTLKKRVLNNRSLFILWKSLYDGFDSTRKGAWQLYWATLPFGSHSGSNGWPGSGYSAFVYVNAPIYKVGGDLQLDPPTINIVVNGGFSPTPDPWDFDDEPNCSWADGFASFNAFPADLVQIMAQEAHDIVTTSFVASGVNGGSLTLFTTNTNQLLFSDVVVNGFNQQTKTVVAADDGLSIFTTDFTGVITDVKVLVSP